MSKFIQVCKLHTEQDCKAQQLVITTALDSTRISVHLHFICIIWFDLICLPLYNDDDDDDNNNNNNNNNHDDIYSAVIYGAAICESSLWFIWAKVSQRQVAANSQAKLQTWPLSPPVGCYRPNIRPSTLVLLLNHRLRLIYRPSEGGRLSRPRHCSQCAAVPKAAY